MKRTAEDISKEQHKETRFEKFKAKCRARHDVLGSGCAYGHMGGLARGIDGVRLTCCNGTGAGCKLSQINWMIKEIRELADENDRLARIVVKKDDKPVEAPIWPTSQPQWLQSAPQTIYNVTNITNNVMIVDSAIAKAAPQIMLAAWQGKNLMQSIVETLQNAPASAEKERLMNLKNSPELADRLDFQREALNTLEDKLGELPVELREKTAAELERLQDDVTKTALSNGIAVAQE